MTDAAVFVQKTNGAWVFGFTLSLSGSGYHTLQLYTKAQSDTAAKVCDNLICCATLPSQMRQMSETNTNQAKVTSSTQSQNILQFPGDIRLIAHDRDMAAVNFEQITAFGFDTETKPAYRKGEVFKTALLQLATDSVAYLIRLHYIKHFEPIREIFENPDVLKVGAAIAQDLKQLQHIFPFQPAGFVDVQKIGKEKGLKNLGLKKMTQEVFNANLFKGPKMTNWERQFLTDEQLLYAATDAWIGLQLYRELNAEKVEAT